MNQIEKFLRKLSKEKRADIEEIILKVQKNDLVSLDIQKLQGMENEFRVRKGNVRIRFIRIESINYISSIEWRSDTTYN